VLVASQLGRLSLVEANRRELVRLGEWDLFDDVPDTERDVWSHPALVDGRVYVRNLLAVYCFLIG